ncbi:glycosyltransferase N-terminal domain-containing protein [Acetobacter estunensis]|uniref:glycosyltransferase N-terminal domain-containing protein n=1 Tax=Acetobacter estunensis TaxID=104097 RepID=UPI001C2D11DA|nr:glycosyltransferase N-terminal domain-containing protein [Acetobacter estunensis]MBV1837840.1 DUF374 domain-containing protein [Acetobacter estunensis]
MTPREVTKTWPSRLICHAIRGWLGFALRTTRWQIELHPEARTLLLADRHKGTSHTGLLVAFWHEALALSPALWWWAEPRNPSLRLHVLISHNRDGRLIAEIVAPWRIPALHGSSHKKGKDKGGLLALRQMRAALLAGDVVTIMPDGPKGPPRTVQVGVLALAEMTGAPILPMGAMCHHWRAPSWDRMLVPLPFGRGRLVCGAPVHVTSETREAAQKLLTERLDAASAEAQRKTDASPEPLAPLSTHPPSNALGAKIWSALATLLAPALLAMLRVRVRRGRELRERLRERMGFSAGQRPDGPLVWFHAASVGETISILPVMRALSADITLLITTGTVTAARLLEREASDLLTQGRMEHRFVPLDVPRWMWRFLRHWKPDALVLTESELWPNLIDACTSQCVPVIVLNGRLSPRALRGWLRAPAFAAHIMAGLTWVAARSPDDAARFRILGAQNVSCDGDLKTAAPPLPADTDMLTRARNALGNRPVWIAASTHEGEEDLVLEAAHCLRQTWPDLLTIIAPRHPERGTDVAALSARAFPDCGLPPRRSQDQWPRPQDAVWIVDTLGELGTVFRLSPIVFMGNSLFPTGTSAKGGGHNPFEPARLGCVLASGPQIGNFEEAFAVLSEAVTIVPDALALADWVAAQLSDPAHVKACGVLAQNAAAHNTALPQQLADRIRALVRYG